MEISYMVDSIEAKDYIVLTFRKISFNFFAKKRCVRIIGRSKMRDFPLILPQQRIERVYCLTGQNHEYSGGATTCIQYFFARKRFHSRLGQKLFPVCLLYTSDAADE